MGVIFIVLAVILLLLAIKILPTVSGSGAFLGLGALGMVFVLFFVGMACLSASGNSGAEGTADGIWALIANCSYKQMAIGGAILGAILAALATKR